MLVDVFPYTPTVKDILDPDETAVKAVPPVPAVTLNLPSAVLPCAMFVFEANSPSKSTNWK